MFFERRCPTWAKRTIAALSLALCLNAEALSQAPPPSREYVYAGDRLLAVIPPPALTVDDASVIEGQSGTRTVAFTVRFAINADGDSAHTAVSLAAGEETLLRDFLNLERPYAVHATIDPPSHPELGPWSVELVRVTPFSASMQYWADSTGQVLLGGIGRGLYNITVVADGQKYFLDRFVVEEQPGPLTIKIPLVAVRGKISLGDNELAATVIFGGRHGSRSVTLQSDSEGKFSGTLPGAGDWRVTIEASEPSVKRTLARVSVEPDTSGTANLDIRLEDSRLRGRVVDLKGNPKRAQVDFFPGASRQDLPASLNTDESGQFVLRGLPPGDLSIEAHTADREQSDTVSVTVGKIETDVTLVVGPPKEIAGQVLSAATLQPVPGAVLYAIPEEQPGILVSPVRAEADGRFRLRLPPRTVSATVMYSAEGHATAIARLRTDGGREVRLLVPKVGGELVVERAEPGKAHEVIPVLVHEGMAIDAVLLARLGRRSDGKTSDPSASSLTVPNVAPGRYALCLMDTAAYRSGNRATSMSGDCSSGTLIAGGQLSLSRPKKGGPSKE